MIISHTNRFIFIKSEKTAGTSIEAAMSQYCSGDDIVTPLGDYGFNRQNGKLIHQSMNAGDFYQHDDALTIKSKVPPEVWKNYYKFSIARNPWDRAVSYFYWAHRRNPALKPRKRFYHYLGVPFNEMAEVKKLFSKFIRDEWQYKERFSNDRFYFIDNELCVDYVIRYERLVQDFDEVCKIVGIPANALPQLKSGIRKKGRHYSEYYDDETRAIVAERQQNDIRLLGYEFESPK